MREIINTHKNTCQCSYCIVKNLINRNSLSSLLQARDILKKGIGLEAQYKLREEVEKRLDFPLK